MKGHSVRALSGELKGCFDYPTQAGNAIPVNRLVAPLCTVPEWYFLAYYAL